MRVRLPNNKGLMVAVFLVGITLASYWRTKDLRFLNYDDNRYVTENVHIRDGLSRTSLAWSLTALYEANWHPLTWISHEIDCTLYGLNPAGHHVTNLIIHLLNVVLLFLMLRSITGALWRSGFVAGLFAVHPLNVESVAWVAERKNVLSTLFFILTIWAYSWYARRPGVRRYITVLLLFVLGLMAKPMLVSLPFVLLLLDYWPLRRYPVGLSQDGLPASGAGEGNVDQNQANRPCPPQRILRLALEKAPLLLLAAACCALTMIAQGKAGAVASTECYPISLRLQNSLVSYAKYLQQTILPGGFSLVYPFPNSIPLWQIGLAAIVLLSVSIAALRARRFKYLIVGWLWYLGTLIPVIGLVQVGSQARADRYTYIPLIGIFVMIVWGLAEWARPRQARPVLAAGGTCILIVLCLVTGRQTGYWHDDITLMRHALSVSDSNYIARSMLATDLFLDGKPDEAIAEFSKIPKTEQSYDKAQNALGEVFFQKGQLDQAIAHFRLAIEANPRYADPYNRLGGTLMEEGRIDEAIPLLYKALEFSPNHPSAWANLGAAFAAKGDTARALEYYDRALQITIQHLDSADTPPQALEVAAKISYRMGDVLASNGKTAEAVERYLEALRFFPGYPPAAQRLSSLPLPTAGR